MGGNQNSNDFLLTIRSVYPALTKAEKRVADFILSDSRAVRFMTINDLADVCGVGLTSVFRFCKTLRLQGYQEFKVQLALSMSQGEEVEVLPGEVTTSDTLEHVAQKLLESHTKALQETLALLDKKALLQAADFINDSDQVRFFGVGGSMLTAMEGMYKFLHIMPNVYCLSDLHMQSMAASTLNERDIAIFISHSGESKEIVRMAKQASQAGARTVCITRYAQSPLAQQAKIVLLCGGYEPPLQEGSVPTKTAQMFVLDLLFTEVYRRKFDYSKQINQLVTTSIVDKNF